MLKLIKLEWKKNHIGKYIRNALIVTVLLCLFVFAMDFLGIAKDPETGMVDTAPGMDRISATIEMFSSIAFLIFTGTMLAAFIVSAYKHKTMNLMFSYPIRRQKILLSQMLAVWLFNIFALVITKLMMYACVLAGSRFITPAFQSDFNMGSLDFYVQLLLKSIVIVSMGFIALFTGLAMKSSKAVLITSFLLILLTQANVGDFTVSNNAVFPLILTAVSFLFAFLSISGVEHRDVQ